MRRHLSGVAALALLVLAGCAAPEVPPVAEVPPTPAVSASSPSSASPAPKWKQVPSAVPTTATDPAQLRPTTATVPARIQVDSVDVAMDVLPVGVEPDGDMALPTTVADAGWYQFGPRPADGAGTTVLAAHVDTRSEGLGPFARLRAVKPGASVVLTTRGGAVHRYRVTSVQSLPKDELSEGAAFDREGPAQLALLTCGGAYDRGNGYSDNVVVTATPESAVKS